MSALAGLGVLVVFVLFLLVGGVAMWVLVKDVPNHYSVDMDGNRQYDNAETGL